MRRIFGFVLTSLLFVAFTAVSLRFVEGPTISANFEQDAPHFHVLGIKDGEYFVVGLSQVRNEPEGYRFHLYENEQRIELGDASFAEVLDETDGKQTIRVFYNNTYMSESIYQVSNDTVVPVEYKILGSMAFAGVYLLVAAVSLATASLLSGWIIGQWQRRR